MFEQLEKYIEATLAALAALLAWCWRIARHDQERGQRIAALEEWRDEHMEQYRELDSKIDSLTLQNLGAGREPALHQGSRGPD